MATGVPNNFIDESVMKQSGEPIEYEKPTFCRGSDGLVVTELSWQDAGHHFNGVEHGRTPSGLPARPK